MCECKETRIVLLSSTNNAKSFAKNAATTSVGHTRWLHQSATRLTALLRHYSAVITVPVSPRKPAAA